jgi:hypothetical protein
MEPRVPFAWVAPVHETEFNRCGSRPTGPANVTSSKPKLEFPGESMGETPWIPRAIDALQTMQSIQTKYLPPTDTKGARIKATCERGTRTIPYPYELSGDSVHREAALQLIERFVAEDWKERATPPSQNPWKRAFVTGSLPDGTMAHVFL